jgi:hypothetical protein
VGLSFLKIKSHEAIVTMNGKWIKCKLIIIINKEIIQTRKKCRERDEFVFFESLRDIGDTPQGVRVISSCRSRD